MATINDNYLKLKAGYLFPEIARRVNAFAQANPDAKIIRLGIGDVTEPLPEACRTAMIKAVDDMGDRSLPLPYAIALKPNSIGFYLPFLSHAKTQKSKDKKRFSSL